MSTPAALLQARDMQDVELPRLVLWRVVVLQLVVCGRKKPINSSKVYFCFCTDGSTDFLHVRSLD